MKLMDRFIRQLTGPHTHTHTHTRTHAHAHTHTHAHAHTHTRTRTRTRTHAHAHAHAHTHTQVGRMEGGREGERERPDLNEGHVHAVHVGPLLPVHLDADKAGVEQRPNLLDLKGLPLHDVAPVAGGVADREEDQLVLVASLLKRLLTPRIPGGGRGMDGREREGDREREREREREGGGGRERERERGEKEREGERQGGGEGEGEREREREGDRERGRERERGWR